MYSPIPQEAPETEVPHTIYTFVGESQARQTQPTCLELWWQGQYTIVPESNHFLDTWDIAIILALVATAVVLPYEVALITELPTQLWYLDTAIDVIFTVDIVVTFNVAYPVNSSRSSETYQRRPLNIASHYMAVPFSQNFSAGWFWPDVATVIPWDSLTGNKGADSVRLVRVLRLIRMLRLVRVVKLFKRWHTHLGFSFALVKVLKCLIITLLITHWIACIWAHMGVHADEYFGSEGWLSQTHPARAGKAVAEFTHFEAYQYSLYLMAVVLTTVGFGDIVPVNQVEIVAMTLTIFATGMVWTVFVANIVDVIGNVDIYALHFNHAMDDLNMLMESHTVSYDLKRRIRRHLHEAYHVHRQRHHQEVIAWLSEGLQGELAVECGVQETCACIWYMRGLRPEWMIDLAQHWKAEMYSPGEFIMHKHSVMVIRKGSCVRRGIVLVRESVMGEDMILVSDMLKDTACPRTINICEMMMLSRSGLVQVCEKHRELNQRLRKAQVKLAVWRAFIFLAHKIRRYRTKKGTWDSYFDADREAEQQAMRNYWGAITKFSRAGWVENIGKHSSNIAATLSSKADLMKGGRDNAAVIAEVRGLRELIEEQSSNERLRLEQLALRLEAIENRPPPALPPAAVSMPSMTHEPSIATASQTPASKTSLTSRSLKGVFSTR